MTRTILFTLAILAGLAAAPDAQTFRWEAGRSHDADVRLRIRDYWREFRHEIREIPRRVNRAVRDGLRAERHAERTEQRIRERVEDRLRRRLDGRSPAGRWATDGGQSTQDPCRDRDYGDRDYYQHCEVREESMAAGPLTVDAGQNGGITVRGADRNDIRIVAIVQASAREEARAKQIASGVQVQAGGGRVSATGPERSSGREWWSVSYRIEVPRNTDLELHANNGGITIEKVTGTIRFDTTNGGVRLADLGGAVRGETSNGGLNVSLAGTTWQGEGLDVTTTNGGVNLYIPEGYNAQLETRTVNGGFRTEYPITITGELNTRRGVTTTLGSGGPSIRVRTTNGGLRLNRR